MAELWRPEAFSIGVMGWPGSGALKGGSRSSFFSSRRRHTRYWRDWSSDVCSSDLKVNVGFTARHWRTLGCNGDTFADTGYQATWEVSRAQRGASGILVDYLGSAGATLSGSAGARARAFLSQLEPVLPGIAARWDGRASLDAWTTNPWTLGSYSYYRVGQY